MTDIYFELKNETLELYRSYNKIFSFLNSAFGRISFKISRQGMRIFLNGGTGAFQLDLPVEFDDDPFYFSVDYNKYTTAIHKYDASPIITFNIKNNTIKIGDGITPDSISLSISSLDYTSNEALMINNYLDDKVSAFLSINNKLTVTNQLIEYLTLANSLFIAQGVVNSVGISKDNLIYADRIAILRAFFDNSLDDELFSTLPEDESYIYVHSFIISLIQTLYKHDSNFYFSDDYEKIYWKDEHACLVITSEPRELSIPTEEQLEEFAPINGCSVMTNLQTLKTSLNFFTGFYEGSVWKPITFVFKAGENPYLRYQHPSAEITKTLAIETPDTQVETATFMLESESLRKVINKLDEKSEVVITYDNDSPGVLFNVEDKCKIIFAKLEDEE